MRVTLWGTRGSLAAPGPETARYGGNTSCVQIEGDDGRQLVLDAGTGIRRLGMALPGGLCRVDLLLTHLHMDHLQGLGFFAPLYSPGCEVHAWGPASPAFNLRTRLTRYLSPPLFPVHLRDLPCELHLHEVPAPEFDLGPFRIASQLVCHPGPTVGYRIENAGSVVTYIPDHEPALGARHFPCSPDWTSGYSLAEDADLLIHDCQYSAEEYSRRVGWGHCSIPHSLQFAALARVRHLVPFHYDPGHTDAHLDSVIPCILEAHHPQFAVTPGRENMTFEVTGNGAVRVELSPEPDHLDSGGSGSA